LNNESVVEQCFTILDQELEQNEKLSYIRNKFKKELETWKTEFRKILNDLINIASNFIGPGNISKTIQNLGNDTSLLIEEIMKDYSKIEEKITNTKTVNLNQISNEISNVLNNISEKIRKIRDNTESIIDELIPYNSKSKISEVSKNLEELYDKIQNIIDHLQEVR